MARASWVHCYSYVVPHFGRWGQMTHAPHTPSGFAGACPEQHPVPFPCDAAPREAAFRQGAQMPYESIRRQWREIGFLMRRGSPREGEGERGIDGRGRGGARRVRHASGRQTSCVMRQTSCVKRHTLCIVRRASCPPGREQGERGERTGRGAPGASRVTRHAWCVRTSCAVSCVKRQMSCVRASSTTHHVLCRASDAGEDPECGSGSGKDRLERMEWGRRGASSVMRRAPCVRRHASCVWASGTEAGEDPEGGSCGHHGRKGQTGEGGAGCAPGARQAPRVVCQMQGTIQRAGPLEGRERWGRGAHWAHDARHMCSCGASTGQIQGSGVYHVSHAVRHVRGGSSEGPCGLNLNPGRAGISKAGCVCITCTCSQISGST